MTEIKLKKKTWSDLKTSQKIIFIASLLLMLGTLIFTGLNLDTLNVRKDILRHAPTSCVFTFINGYFDNVYCHNENALSFINESGRLDSEYDLEDYYNDFMKNDSGNVYDYGKYDIQENFSSFG